MLTNAIKGNKKGVCNLTIDGVVKYNNKEKTEIISEVFANSHNTTRNITSPVDNIVKAYRLVECPKYNRRYTAKLDISGRNKILHRYTEKFESSWTGWSKLHYIEKYNKHFLHINYTDCQLVFV